MLPTSTLEMFFSSLMPKAIRPVALVIGLCGPCLVGCAPNYGPPESGGGPDQPAPYARVSTQDEVEVVRSSHYLRMRDGIRIAIDVYVPKNVREEDKVPTILHQTRYWRSLDYRWPLNWINGSSPRGFLATFAKRFLASGYAWVDVDARGTGASYGFRKHSHTPEEIKDGAEVVDWILQQPWSNGRVGTLGMSYDGTSAEFLLVNQHPAVKAAAPMYSAFDAYREIAFPGGMHLIWFTDSWTQLNRSLDRNRFPLGGWLAQLFVKGVLPVDGDSESRVLAGAIQDHAANWSPHREALGITYRDDAPPSKMAANIDVLSPHSYVKEVADSNAAIYSYSGWFDGAYPHAAIRRYLTLNHPRHKLILGPWDHGGRRHISPAHIGKAQFDHIGELLKFFDYHVKGVDTGIMAEPPIHYFTMGEERWKATDAWPPQATPVSFYFSRDRRLTTEPPTTPESADTVTVDFTAGTGEQSRWHTLMGRPITDPYPDRAAQDQKLLTYTTAPLDRDTEVTGHPLITLYVSSTARDGSFLVYLEDLDKTGRVSYVTEGLLRALHRRLSDASPPYRDVVPYRTFTREDGRVLIPGEVATLRFDLIPTSYLFKRGHRIRIALAGADKDHFAMLSDTPPTVTYYRSKTHPSRIELPVVQRAGP